MAEIDILFVIIPIVISAAALFASIVFYTKKADADQVNSVRSHLLDHDRRLSHLEGRQHERDTQKRRSPV